MLLSFVVNDQINQNDDDGDVGSNLHDAVPSNRRAEDTVGLAGLNYHHLVIRTTVQDII